MKRTLSFIICASFLLTLCGCGVIRKSAGNRHERIRKESIEYGEQQEKVLCECAQELIGLVTERDALPQADLTLSYKITQRDGDTMRMQDYIRETETEIRSELCQKVLEGGVVQSIAVHYDSERFNVVFSCGGSGMGPNTSYYQLEYVPTGAAQDMWFYSERLPYEETDDGYYAEESNGDDSFFYHPISEYLYYCEASF